MAACSKPFLCRLKNLFFTHKRDEEELKELTPHNIRLASHDLTNATWVVEQNLKTVREKATALTALVERMQGDEPQ